MSVNRNDLRKIVTICKKDEKFMKQVMLKYGGLDFEGSNTKIINAIKKDKVLEKKFKNIFLPKRISEICKYRIIFNSDMNIIASIKLVLCLIDINSEKINLYLNLKQKYEKKLFLNKYVEAYEIINKIENDVCISIWSCSQRMLLEEFLHGLEGNKKLLSYYIQQSRDNLIIKVLLEFYSYCSERNMGFINYEDKINKFIQSIEDEVVRDYFDFKLNFNREREININSILQFDSQISIVDMYNSLIEILQELSYKDSFIHEYEWIRNYLSKINDLRIENIDIRYSYFKESKLSDYFINNKEVYSILELYTIGDYCLAIKRIEEYLIHNSTNFQIVSLLIKSYLNSNKVFETEIQIYKDIYNLYAMNSSIDDSINNLYGYIKLYNGTSWKVKIQSLLKRKLLVPEIVNEKQIYMSYINDLILTPSFVKFVLDKSEFLKRIKIFCNRTASLYEYINGFSDNLNSDIEERRKNFYHAIKDLRDDRFTECIERLCLIKEDVCNTDFYNLERVLSNLVIAYLDSGMVYESLKLAVDSYFLNPHMIRRFDLKKIYESIYTTDNDRIKRDINYPIFVYITDKNDYKKQRIAYSNYLDYNNITTIEDILTNNCNEDIRKVIFFLYKICVQHLLKRDIRLSPKPSQADEVRIKILRLLIDIDSINRKIYYDEINTITMKRSIKDRAKQINQSRIYVDVENIKIENRSILIENFEKYMEIKKFEDKVTSIDVNSNEYLEYLNNIISEMNNRITTDVNYTQEVIVLKDLISKITEEFLYNEKYGLNTFLSSRIRHGYCRSQLTTIFNDYSLMLKSVNDNSKDYLINEYWEAKEKNSSSDFELFKSYLAEFTLKIENKVGEIKNEWIRIKFRPYEKGIFDYCDIINYSLIIDNDDIRDFDTLFDNIIEILWSKTNSNLSILRQKINTELKTYFINALLALEEKVSTLQKESLDQYIQEALSNINLCKVKIENVIKEFSEVFYKRDILYRDFTMQDLISTCLDISKKLNSSFDKVNLIKDISVQNIFKGESFSYFVDIFNILINNSLEHSNYDDLSKLNLAIIITSNIDKEMINCLKEALKNKGIELKSKEFMYIIVRNSLEQGTDSQLIKEKIEKSFSDFTDNEALKKYTQTEGGSGLFKLNKTLQYNIEAPFSIFYKITNEYCELSILMGIDKLIVEEKN